MLPKFIESIEGEFSHDGWNPSFFNGGGGGREGVGGLWVVCVYIRIVLLE